MGPGMMGFYIMLCTVHTTVEQGQGTIGLHTHFPVAGPIPASVPAPIPTPVPVPVPTPITALVPALVPVPCSVNRP